MTDPAQAARDDLAFMKGLADDKEPLPWGFGAYLLAPGLLYAPIPLLIWAQMSGAMALPESWLPWLWVPATALFIPVFITLQRKAPVDSLGPNRKFFAASWTAVSVMSVIVLMALYLAQLTSRAPYLEAWPMIAFTLYGGVWTMIALTHRRWWYALVAGGAFGTALLSATLVGSPALWLAMGIGLLLWIAAPGFAIMQSARKA